MLNFALKKQQQLSLDCTLWIVHEQLVIKNKNVNYLLDIIQVFIIS